MTTKAPKEFIKQRSSKKALKMLDWQNGLAEIKLSPSTRSKELFFSQIDNRSWILLLPFHCLLQITDDIERIAFLRSGISRPD